MHKDQVPGVDFTLLIAGPAVPGVLAADAAYSGSTGPGKDPFLVQYLCTGWRFVCGGCSGRGTQSAFSLHRSPRLPRFYESASC
jgi:hypothetical protein